MFYFTFLTYFVFSGNSSSNPRATVHSKSRIYCTNNFQVILHLIHVQRSTLNPAYCTNKVNHLHFHFITPKVAAFDNRSNFDLIR